MKDFRMIMAQREAEEREAIRRGDLVKREVYNDHRYKEKFEVYNAPKEWTERNAIDYCDPHCFVGYAQKGRNGVWYVRCDID